MGSMRLRPGLEAFVWHGKGMGIVQALSTIRKELYDSGRPQIYYEYAPPHFHIYSCLHVPQ